MDEELIDDNFKIPVLERATGDGRLPSDMGIYLKGLLGLILCVLPGAIIGLVLVKASIDQAKYALIEFHKTPELYSKESYMLVIRGRKLAYIGMLCFILELVLLMVYMSMN